MLRRQTANARVLRPAEWGPEPGAQQQFQTADVRFGSKADIGVTPIDVRFTPKSGHGSEHLQCLLCAKRGHCHHLFDQIVSE
jgi:hypothetical protein